MITLSWSAANCLASTAVLILPNTSDKYAILWSQVKESSVATIWIVLRRATESALRISLSSSAADGSLKKRLSIDKLVVAMFDRAVLIALETAWLAE